MLKISRGCYFNQMTKPTLEFILMGDVIACTSLPRTYIGNLEHFSLNSLSLTVRD